MMGRMTAGTQPAWTVPDDSIPRASLRQGLSRLGRERDGSMALESAFVLPVFFLLLLGIFEMSLLLAGYCSASYAVRMGARYASVRSSSSLSPASSTDVQSQVQSNLFLPGASSSQIVVTYTYGTSNTVGAIVNVGMLWSLSINLPGYHSTLNMNTQAHRVIIR